MAASASPRAINPAASSASTSDRPSRRAAPRASWSAAWARCLPRRGREHAEDPLRRLQALTGVDVRPHPGRVDLEPVDAAGGQPQRGRREQADLGQRDPLRLPAAAVSLVQLHHALEQHAGVGANEAGERVEVLARLRVALVRHHDAADPARTDRFAQLADLGPLELHHLVADACQGAADRRHDGRELGDAVAAREPRDAGVGEAEPLGEAGPQRRTGLAVEAERADGAAELRGRPSAGGPRGRDPGGDRARRPTSPA